MQLNKPDFRIRSESLKIVCPKKQTKILMLTVLLLTLTGCVGSVKSTPTRIDLPPELSAACDAPVQLGEDELTQSRVETLWEQDRGALVECADRVKALQDIIGEIK